MKWRALVVLAVFGSVACAPALNWREVRPEGSGALALFPCKPAHHTRTVRLAGAEVALTLSACTAGGVTYALGHADVGDPTRVTAALAELGDAAARNLGAAAAPGTAADVKGMTPNLRAQRLSVRGSLPDGTAVQEQLILFAKGTRVFQATVLGAATGEEATSTFFDALRLPP